MTSTATATATHSRTWSPVLAGLHSHALDCLQVNLAAIADQAYGPGSHLALGSTLRFSVQPGAKGMPTVSASLAERLAQAQQLLGLTVLDRRDAASASQLLDLAAEHSPVYVVADAYDMSWLAYFGRQHMEHSFLLTEGGPPSLVVDGYANSTAWGDSLPGVWRLPAGQLESCAPTSIALSLEPRGLPALDANLTLAANAVAMAESAPAISDYLAELRQRRAEPAMSDQLTLDIWLLSRSRALHASWLAARAPGSTGALAAATQAQAWQGLAAHSYLAARRVHRGGELSERLLDELAEVLTGDARLARQLAVPAVQEVLVAEVSAVLGGDQPALRGDADSVGAAVLRDLPNFSSYRLVDIIDRTMSRLTVDVDPDRLTGSSLRDIASLRELFLPPQHQAGAL